MMGLIITECHVKPDVLLVYWIDEEIGSHANLFRNKMGKSLPDRVEINFGNLNLTLKAGLSALPLKLM